MQADDDRIAALVEQKRQLKEVSRHAEVNI